MSYTEKAKYTFTVKEGEVSQSGADDAAVWIMLEPDDRELTIAASGFLSLRLRPGAKMVEAQDVAQFLNRHIEAVAFTKPRGDS